MANGKIDPAFISAPYLGGSSHDPVEFARRQKLAKFQAKETQQRELEATIAEGLQNLMLDVKSWEDKQGFQEILDDQNRVLNGFMQLSRKGMNLTNPKTTEEILAYKTINEEHEKIKNKVDTWNTQKTAYDLIQKAIIEDSARLPSEQKIDREATMKNMNELLTSTKILDRGNKLQNLLVTKPEIGDVHKYVADNLEFITKPDIVTEPYTDPNTGLTVSKTREIMTPENEKKREQDLRKLFQTAPTPIITAVQTAKAKDKTAEMMSDEDYFVSMYDPQFKQKMSDVVKGTGGGLSLNFLGQKTTMDLGTQRKEPLIYGDKTFTSPYEFTSTKPLRVPLGAEGSEIFMGNQWAPLTGGGDVEASLSFYDSNTDKFIFRTTQAGVAPFVMNNMTIAVPRSVIGDQADDLPIRVDGKVMKLKDVYGTVKAPEVKTIGGKDFRGTTPYIPTKLRK